MYDIIILGAGVIGCAVARELSKYNAKILVLEKNEDVCSGTSKANSGIVHSGYDAHNGTLKARFNIEGNRMMGDVCDELDVPFDRIGSLTVCTNEKNIADLEALRKRGEKNGVEGLRILDRAELLAMEPHIGDEVVAALYAPTAGVICPFKLTIAFAENAAVNGAEFRFDSEVKKVYCDDGVWHVVTDDEEFATAVVVNAAGVYADVFHNMVSAKKLRITPRRGDYILLDRAVQGFVNHTVFQLPTKLGKGVLVTPTVHGNTIVGPTAVDMDDKECTATFADGIDSVIEKSALSVKALPTRQVITSFAGLRAHEDGGDFILGEPDDAPGFFDCAGIESPGLTASPAIGVYIAELIRKKYSLSEKEDFIAQRKDILNPSTLSLEERNELIRREPAYGNIICRCESVTEGEILDAIRRPVGARSLDGVKRRTRAGMGRCQAGFCSPKVMEILRRELNIDLTEVTKSGGASKIVFARTKDGDSNE
ncbi:NAD(P)/FAD-dependent oxidoreductase [Ruminococcus sp.]|uniref:NAD(P)/FAD-dependent oxidoreductase n=1 Tax=Ruminococcus sp. TaxID=41978 RepID=UPI002E808916|nr:NAD(P)/FAD-dependent oxidoreductase [Ruminococcus sp.]MEE3492803.1 NAD(P)/FAD-dependent oxidoreductase [Ruminococcus sp.]